MQATHPKILTDNAEKENKNKNRKVKVGNLSFNVV